MKLRGTPIERTRDVDNELIQRFKRFGINTIECFLSLIRVKENAKNLAGTLMISTDDLYTVMVKAQQGMLASVGVPVSLPVRSSRRYPLGAATPRLLRRSGKVSPVKNPYKAMPYADLRQFMTPVKDQGDRGTCVAFALLAAVEAMENKQSNVIVDLSEQCLFYHCKKRDNVHADGTLVSEGIKVLQKNGVCSEAFLPYEPIPDPKDPAQSLPATCKPYPCINHHKRYKIKKERSLFDISEIKRELESGHPVVGVIPVYKSWYEDGWIENTGQLIMPLPVDLQDPSRWLGNHAICLAGYDDQTEMFFFKNSWGTKWAPNSYYGEGYGQVPFDYIDDFCKVVYAIDYQSASLLQQ